MEELLHKAMKVEQQLKRKGLENKSSSNYNSSSWRDRNKNDGAASSNKSAPLPQEKTQSMPLDQPPKKSKEVKCFKCQGLGHYAYECATKQTMILKDNGEYTSESEASGGEGSEG